MWLLWSIKSQLKCLSPERPLDHPFISGPSPAYTPPPSLVCSFHCFYYNLYVSNLLACLCVVCHLLQRAEQSGGPCVHHAGAQQVPGEQLLNVLAHVRPESSPLPSCLLAQALIPCLTLVRSLALWRGPIEAAANATSPLQASLFSGPHPTCWFGLLGEPHLSLSSQGLPDSLELCALDCLAGS